MNQKYLICLHKAAYWLARRLAARVVYYCGVRIIAHATTGKYSDTVVPELTATECLRRYAEDHNL